MWIDGTVDARFDADGLSALSVTWLFDEFNSAEMIFSLDTNLDGRISESENESIRAQAFSHLGRTDYFLVVFAGTRRVVIPDATEFRASITDGRLQYRFVVPVRVGWRETEDLVIALFDRSYFIDFLTEAARPVLVHTDRDIRLDEASMVLESDGWGTIRVPAVKVVVR